MNAREKILNAIVAGQPEFVSLPVMDIDTITDTNYNDYTQFKFILETIGGKVISVENIHDLNKKIEQEKTTRFVINTYKAIGKVDEQLSSYTAKELEKVDTVYIKGTIGVAENGAVWIYESQMGNRLLPFICQHLILIIDKKDIVPTMHHAYNKIDIASEGFGVFIAGPSKTADIEQSLVIGAHGARSTTVYIIG